MVPDQCLSWHRHFRSAVYIPLKEQRLKIRDVVIVSACRTPIGDFAGSLSTISATDLGALVINEAISRAGITKDDVDEVIMGCVLPHGLGQNPARQAMIRAGLPWDVGAITVKRIGGH